MTLGIVELSVADIIHKIGVTRIPDENEETENLWHVLFSTLPERFEIGSNVRVTLKFLRWRHLSSICQDVCHLAPDL